MLFLGTWVMDAASAQNKPRVVEKEDLIQLISEPNDSVLVINFWATWCKPCVRELPHFLGLDSAFATQKVKLVLVSLDFESDLETKLEPFLARRQIKNTVWLMRDLNYNAWIGRIHSEWDGVIPATLLLSPRGKKRDFVMGEISQEVLYQKIKQFLKP